MAQSLADAGAITADEVKKHPLRHMLTGAITTKGGRSTIQLQHLGLADGDQVLLCSDGLTDMVGDDAIAGILDRPGPSEPVCQALVDRALEAGGKDNVTVVLARYRINA
jgi:serine/threonine protein phosphatase PrpC